MTAGLYGKSIYSFVGNFQTVFQSGCTILHFHQQCMRVPVAPHPTGFVGASNCLMCLSQMTYDLEHLFIYLFAICIVSLVKRLLKSLVYFLIELFIFYCRIWTVLCIFWETVFCQPCLLQVSSPSLWLVFSLSWQCLSQKRIFKF